MPNTWGFNPDRRTPLAGFYSNNKRIDLSYFFIVLYNKPGQAVKKRTWKFWVSTIKI